MGQMKLYWESSAWEDYEIYCELARPDEIAGMGEIEMRNNKIVVTKLHLIKQEVSPGSADFDDEAYCAFFEEYCNNGGKPENLRLWWHTHPNMSVEFSAKDRNTIKETMKGSKWFVATVINERGDRQGELIVSEPDFIPPIKIGKEDFVIVHPSDRVDELKAEVKDKVSKRSYTTTYVKTYPFGQPPAGGKWQDELEDWYGGYVRGTKPHTPYGGYNGLGAKDTKTPAKGVAVPSVVKDGEKPADIGNENVVVQVPEGEILRENVTADIVNNIKALVGVKE